MVKISVLPPEETPTVNDKLPIVDAETSTTKYVTVEDLIAAIFNNVPAGAIPGSIFDYVISGGVWTGDSYGSNRDASMTAMTVYINSRSISIAAVTARNFTASKDTYVDVLDNLDGTGTLVYTEVSNNAASPALAANSLRIGIIVTGATTIANAGSVNQGEVDKVLPIASSIAYSVTDSLGNLICPRDPNRKLLGYRQIVSAGSGNTSASATQVTGLTVPVIVPSGRKVKVTFGGTSLTNTTTNITITPSIWDGTVGSGTQIQSGPAFIASADASVPNNLEANVSPTSGLHTYNAATATAGGTVKPNASSTAPAFIKVELE